MSSHIEEKIQIIKDSKISEIDFGKLKIGNHWAEKIAEALKANSSLQSINLAHKKIGSEGAGKIAEALKVNSSLQIIDLGGNKIGAEGAGKISEALKMNSFLQSIELEGNAEIGETLLQEIGNYIERNLANFKFQQKLASICLFEVLSKRRGRLDWYVVMCDFFPLLGVSKIN
jgi:hypothetical protein